MFTISKIAIAVSFGLALAMSAHAESSVDCGVSDKPVAELQYMSADELKSEICFAQATLAMHGKKADLYSGAGRIDEALSAIKKVTACQAYINLIARVLTKDHKGETPADCVTN